MGRYLVAEHCSDGMNTSTLCVEPAQTSMLPASGAHHPSEYRVPPAKNAASTTVNRVTNGFDVACKTS